MLAESEFQTFCAILDVDEELLEVLQVYLQQLLVIGVNLGDLELQEAIEGNITYLESACRAVVGYAGWLVQQGKAFETENHATRCMVRALTDRWQVHATWEQDAAFAEQAKYVSPYERAYRLICQLYPNKQECQAALAKLVTLSDEELERLILELLVA